MFWYFPEDFQDLLGRFPDFVNRVVDRTILPLSVNYITQQVGIGTIQPKTYAASANAVLVVSGGSYFTNEITASGGIAFASFSVNLAAGLLNLDNNVWTKITNTSTSFNFNSLYNSTASRLEPQKTGKYVLFGRTTVSGTNSGGTIQTAIYGNGSIEQIGPAQQFSSTDTNAMGGAEITTIINVTSTSDYYELFAYHTMGAARNARHKTTSEGGGKDGQTILQGYWLSP